MADINFYECAYRCSESACTAILKKIIINDADISAHLIREVLDKIYSGVQMKAYVVSARASLYFISTDEILYTVFRSISLYPSMYSYFFSCLSHDYSAG